MSPSIKTIQRPHQAPPNWTGTPNSIISDAKRVIEHSRNTLDDIIRTVQPNTATYANVLAPLAQDDNAIYSECNMLEFYKDVSPDPEVREASGEATKLLRDYHLERRMREDLYQLVDAVKNENEVLDPEDRFFLENQHTAHTRNGLKLPAGPQRDRFREIKQRLNQLSIEFRRNDREARDALWLTPQELEGIPADTLSKFENGIAENEGKLKVKLDQVSSSSIYRFCTSDTRKRVFIARENRAVENAPIFKETVVLRDEAARMLGYPNHAAFRLEVKMAKTPGTVTTFLAELKSRLVEAGQKELELMKQLKREECELKGEAFDGRFYLWDHIHHKQILLRTKYAVDQEKISEYFPLQTTIDGMLDVFQHVFGLVFVEITGDERDELAASGNGKDLVWHADVQIFMVWDDEGEGGAFLGYLYIDAFPREGKRDGVSNYDIQPVRTPFLHHPTRSPTS